MNVNSNGWMQLALYVVALALITRPMGLYLIQVLDVNGRTWFDPLLGPLERFTYRLMGVDSTREHDWKQYTLAAEAGTPCCKARTVAGRTSKVPLETSHPQLMAQ
jgi:K+-transporting ATPase A subunit